MPPNETHKQLDLDPQDTEASGEPPSATTDTDGQTDNVDAQGNHAAGNGAMFNSLFPTRKNVNI